MDGASNPVFAGNRPSGVPVVLRVGGQAWRATPERTWLIGRADEADVRLDEPVISRRHATLEPTPDGWVLVNHSSNGMFVDGQRVERLAVQHPMNVSLGAVPGLVVHLQPEHAPAQQPPAPAPPTLPPADWYPDPAGSGRLRYFDGSAWTEHYSAPAPAQQVAPAAPYGGGYPAGAQGYSMPPPGLPGQGNAGVFQIKLHKHTGLVILMLRQSYVVTGSFEECERAYRAAQTHNLLAGWWGLLSALIFNWIALFSNMSAMQQLRHAAQGTNVR